MAGRERGEQRQFLEPCVLVESEQRRSLAAALSRAKEGKRRAAPAAAPERVSTKEANELFIFEHE